MDMPEEFMVTRWSIQGFPFTPCIFVITVEQSSVAIRHNVKIQGITQSDIVKI